MRFRFQARTIRQKVGRAVFGGVGTSLALMLLAAVLLLNRFYVAEGHHQLRTYADVVAAGIGAAVQFETPEEIVPVLEKLCQSSELDTVFVLRPRNGTLLAAYPPNRRLTDDIAALGEGYHPSPDGLWHITSARDLDGHRFATLVLHGSLRKIDGERRVAQQALGGVALLMLLLAVALTRRLTRALVNPVHGLAAAMARIEAAPDQRWRVPKVSEDEIGTLAEGINHMLAALDVQAEVLRLNQERLRDAQKIAGLGNWIFDHGTGRIEWSAEVHDIFERPKFDGTLDAFIAIVHEQDRPAVEQAFKLSVDQREIYDIQHRIVTTTGREKWVVERGQTIYAPDRRPLRTLGTVQDVTERAAAEEQIRRLNANLEQRVTERTEALSRVTENLRASEERLSFLLGSSPAVTYSARVDDGFRVTYVSANVQERLGHAAARFTEAADFWMEHVHPADGELLLRNLRAITGQDSRVNEYRFRHADGSWRWLRDELKLVSSTHGEPVEFVGCWIDITELKEAQQERERLIANLESKNAELEQFTYTVSHDLKSPLITIKGFLGMLEQDLGGDVEQAADDMRRINAATDHMTELLNDLLELSRIGRVCNEPEEVPLRRIVTQVSANLQGLMRQSQAELHVADDLPDVFGDRLRLIEVLQNLVENAIKYRRATDRPVIEIGTRPSAGAEVLITVRDNGLGLAPENLEKIFGLFKKLNRKSEGTGLGLAMVRRIVEFHGGRVWAESAGSGNGTTFCFTLPKPIPETDADEASPTLPRGEESKKEAS